MSVKNEQNEAASVSSGDSKVSKKTEDALNVKISDEDEKYDSVLTYEQLRIFEKDPKWVKIRIATVSIFWVSWLLLLAIAIVIIVLSPKCGVKQVISPETNAIIYNIEVGKFKVGGDGQLGNLKGLNATMDYLSDMGITFVSLSPLFTGNENCDFRVVSDYATMNPEFGSLSELKDISEKLSVKSINLMLTVPRSVKKERNNCIVDGVVDETAATDILAKLTTFSKDLNIKGYIFEGFSVVELGFIDARLKSQKVVGDDSKKDKEEKGGHFKNKWVLYSLVNSNEPSAYVTAFNNTNTVVKFENMMSIEQMLVSTTKMQTIIPQFNDRSTKRVNEQNHIAACVFM